jgi:hypothetical protein
MISTRLLATGLSAVALLTIASCNRSDVQAKTTAPAVTAQAAPTAERLAERAAERWKRVAKAEWIEAYDFLTPDMKQKQKLSQFIQGKETHEYTNPRVGEVMKIEKDQGFIRTSALWTPHHPALAKVKLEPGQTFTESIDMIETWRFVGGDWYYVTAHNEEVFFEHHPEMLKKDASAPATETK